MATLRLPLSGTPTAIRLPASSPRPFETSIECVKIHTGSKATVASERNAG